MLRPGIHGVKVRMVLAFSSVQPFIMKIRMGVSELEMSLLSQEWLIMILDGERDFDVPNYMKCQQALSKNRLFTLSTHLFGFDRGEFQWNRQGQSKRTHSLFPFDFAHLASQSRCFNH